MINWKNSLENIILVVVMFLGLGIYTKWVLTPTLKEAIRTETTKIENNIEQSTENKFRRIESLINTTSPSLPIDNTQNLEKGCQNGSICIPISDLTNRQKRRLGID